MDKSLDTIVYVKKRKRSDVSKDTIPYVDPGVQQQDQVNVDHSDDDFVQHNESGTSSKVPVEKKIQPTVRETRGRKKKATVVDSDVPNLPVRRTKRALVKCVASKGPSPSIPEESVKKSTSFLNVATVKDFYPVGRELKKSILQNLKFEPVYLPKKPRGFDGKDEFNIKFDEVIELLKSKKGSSVPKDFEENVEDSCSENQNVGGNDDELPDPLSPESASPAVDDEVEVLDVLPLQSSVAVKRQTKPRLHCRSPFVNEFGSSEPKVQNKKDKEPSSELAFDPKELFPFIKEIGKITGTEDCGEYVKWIEGARLLKKKNNEKIAGDINPPFDFSIAQIDDKSWFVILQTCGKELFDLAKHDPSVIKYDNMVTDYFLGQYNFCFQPWIGVNDVVGPCHVGLQQHWIFLHFNILRRKIFVFNSMKNTKTNQKKILPDLLAYCELLPYFLDFLNFYDGRNDINLESGPYVVPKDTPIAYEFVDKLPTQSRR
ncbi:hypothetical protein CsatA_009686 [Cannabis sativa]